MKAPSPLSESSVYAPWLTSCKIHKKPRRVTPPVPAERPKPTNRITRRPTTFVTRPVPDRKLERDPEDAPGDRSGGRADGRLTIEAPEMNAGRAAHPPTTHINRQPPPQMDEAPRSRISSTDSRNRNQGVNKQQNDGPRDGPRDVQETNVQRTNVASVSKDARKQPEQPDRSINEGARSEDDTVPQQEGKDDSTPDVKPGDSKARPASNKATRSKAHNSRSGCTNNTTSGLSYVMTVMIVILSLWNK